MKKLILVSILVLAVMSVQGQSEPKVYIGSHKDYIIEQYESFYDCSTEYIDGTEFLQCYGEDITLIYPLNKDGVSETLGLIPKNEYVLKDIVEIFNEEYVIISDIKWKVYTGNGILTISIQALDNGTLYFFYE